MPIVRPSSDLQRNIASIYDLCQSTGEPVYITRNGQAELVVMDASAFDEQMDLQRRIYDREMRIQKGVERGRKEIEDGQGVSLSAALASIDAAWGFDE